MTAPVRGDVAARLRAAARLLVLGALALALASLPFLHARHGGPHAHHADERVAAGTAPTHTH